MRSVNLLVMVYGLAICSSCSFFKTKEAPLELDKIKEFDQAIKIDEVPTTVEPKKEEVKKVVSKKKKKEKKKEKEKKTEAKIEKAAVHEPSFEDPEGFIGRRPIVDPYRVGENVTLAVKYFGVVAGDLTLEVGKMVEVNGKRAYSFNTTVKSNPSFAIFYEVNDLIKTFVDFETLLPLGYTVRLRETNEVEEGRNIFDWQAMKSRAWNKYVEGNNVKEEKDEQDIMPFTQNVFSAIFYLRSFTLKEGKELVFRVFDKGKTLLFKGKIIRKEVLETELGSKNTIIVKPEFEMDGAFKPVGDIYFWLTDDDRKFVVRIESKIKIGRLVGELKSLVPGEALP